MEIVWCLFKPFKLWAYYNLKTKWILGIEIKCKNSNK
jgi:hypothetical protein